LLFGKENIVNFGSYYYYKQGTLRINILLKLLNYIYIGMPLYLGHDTISIYPKAIAITTFKVERTCYHTCISMKEDNSLHLFQILLLLYECDQLCDEVR
jgi:hypothetical protein